MTIENVIRKAIEGGWNWKKMDKLWWLQITEIANERVYFTGRMEMKPPEFSATPVEGFSVHITEILLDSLFWQFAFGKENGRMRALETS